MVNNATRYLFSRSYYRSGKRLLNKIIKHNTVSKIFIKNHSVCGMASEIHKKFTLPKKLSGFSKNVWVEYIQLAQKYNPVNLGQGFPDFFPPSHIVAALGEVTTRKDPFIHQYARSNGHPRLVKALAKLYSPLIKTDIDPMTEVLIGVGATQILFDILCGHLQEGDEAIIIEPFFDIYYPIVKMSGATPVFIPIKPKRKLKDDNMTTGDWSFDRDEMTKLFNEKTKLIIVNTPHNPVGKVYTMDELEFIADLCKKWNVLCVADEVYEWMIYECNKHIRMASLPGMWERTITVGSAGKAFSITGWKIGWAYGPAHMLKNPQVVHQNCVYTCASVLQEAIAIGLEKELELFGTPESYFEKIKAELGPKRDFMVNSLREMGMKPIVPEGGYFVIADWTPLAPKIDMSEEKDEEKDYKFTKWMTKNVGVLAIPPSTFYSEKNKSLGENYARFCFMKQDENLQKAADRLLKWKASLK